MKRLVCSLALVALLASGALAGTVKFSRFLIDVPDGWSAEEQEKSIALLAPGSAAAISIVWDTSDAIPAKDLAQAMAKQLKGSRPVPEDGGYAFTFMTASGVRSKSFLFGDDREYMMLTVTGEHPQLGRVLKSLQTR